KGLPAVLEVGPLGGQEAEGVGAAREADRLAEAAGSLEEGDLAALGGVRVTAGEAAVVAGEARGARERPRRPARVVPVGAGATAERGRLEAALSEAGDELEADVVEEGGVVLAVGVEADKGDGVAAGRHRKGGGVGAVAGALGLEGAHHLAVD